MDKARFHDAGSQESAAGCRRDRGWRGPRCVGAAGSVGPADAAAAPRDAAAAAGAAPLVLVARPVAVERAPLGLDLRALAVVLTRPDEGQPVGSGRWLPSRSRFDAPARAAPLRSERHGTGAWHDLSPYPAPTRHPHPAGGPAPRGNRPAPSPAGSPAPGGGRPAPAAAPAPAGTPAPAGPSVPAAVPAPAGPPTPAATVPAAAVPAVALGSGPFGRDSKNGQSDGKHDREFARHGVSFPVFTARAPAVPIAGFCALTVRCDPAGQPRRGMLPILAFSGLIAASLVGLLLLPPIPQVQDYHQFADRRTIFGIPNFWNIVSNLPFLIAGVAGLWRFHRHATAAVFFLGVFLTGIGSSYYHWAPHDGTLFWDRLPMTMSFAALLALVVGDRVGTAAGVVVLWPVLALGVFSLLWWLWTDDLRLYFWVQFSPVFAAIFLFFLYPARYTGSYYWIIAILLYAFAKLFEFADRLIYSAGNLVSGHALKHFAAAAACFAILRYFRVRRPVAAGAAAACPRSRQAGITNPAPPGTNREFPARSSE